MQTTAIPVEEGGGPEAGRHMLDHVKVPALAVSLGGVDLTTDLEHALRGA